MTTLLNLKIISVQNGITNRDQQKILAALKELEVEEIKFGELPEVAKLEIR